VERSLGAYARTMFAQRMWSGAVRQAFPQVADIVYAVVSVWISSTMLRNWPNSQGYWRHTDVWAYVLIALVYLPLAVRRRAPLTVLVSTAACTLCYFTLGYYHVVVVCGLGLAFYTVAARCPRRAVAKCAAGSLLVLLWGTRLAEPGLGPLSAVFVTVTVAVLWVTGDRARRLAERGERLAVLTEQLRLEQEEKAQRAVMAERMKMARELHDGLGSMLSGIKHSFSAMKNQLDLNESQQIKFHANIDKLNESIKELRNISHSMASDSLLKYGLDNSLRNYCNNMSQSGELNISFKALHTEKMKLREEQSFHIFRIVQELLQNIVKHAGPAHAIVQISYNAKKLYITVEDDGNGFEMNSTIRKNGMGLKSIESRIKILKGRMDYQTAPSKGTSVLIEISCKENR